MKMIFNLPTYKWNYFKLLPEYEVAMVNVSAAELNVEAFHKKRGKLAEGDADMVLVVLRSTVWDLIKGRRAEGFKTVFGRAQKKPYLGK